MASGAGGWGIALVAVAAALWGSDGVFRRGLALELPAATVVFWEHLILTLLVSRTLRRAIEKASGLGARQWGALILIGAGASASATALFTAAFQAGDPNTPLLLQKLQPLFAIAAAALFLGERLRARFGGYAAVAITGAWLISFPDPLAVGATAGRAALLAIGAAALWGAGTVLGRHMTAYLEPGEITALRFGIGLPASAVLVVVTGGTSSFAIGGGDVVPLFVLALIPGLLALTIYYRGLRTTPASMATLAELAFPLSALMLNYLVFRSTITASQALGIVLVSGVLIVMSRAAHSDGPRAVGVDEPAMLEPAV
jgi:drug/metabolite transporter (DMT)-like permease